MGQGFLQISMLNVGKADVDSVTGLDGVPTIRNFRFSDVRVSDVPSLVDAVNIDPGGQHHSARRARSGAGGGEALPTALTNSTKETTSAVLTEIAYGPHAG